MRAKLCNFKSNNFYGNLNDRFYNTMIWIALETLEDDDKIIYSHEKVDIYSLRLVFYAIFAKESLHKLESDSILTLIMKSNIYFSLNLILILTYHIYSLYVILVDEILEHYNDS